MSKSNGANAICCFGRVQQLLALVTNLVCGVKSLSFSILTGTRMGWKSTEIPINLYWFMGWVGTTRHWVFFQWDGRRGGSWSLNYCTLIRCTLVEKGVSGCKFAIPNQFFCMFLPCFWARSGPVMATSPKMIVNVRKTSPKDLTIRTIGCLGTTSFIICSDSVVSLLRSRPLTPPETEEIGLRRDLFSSSWSCDSAWLRLWPSSRDHTGRRWSKYIEVSHVYLVVHP